ncbi:hypothetical protein [Micromonospora orduensis]|uniref:hypothetical protein n=1 Tax=Micromonospora orduensis TaxID=1420891 RepID=UPI001FCC00D0|nr:hypothetical protein [Micromonospora orduensis]
MAAPDGPRRPPRLSAGAGHWSTTVVRAGALRPRLVGQDGIDVDDLLVSVADKVWKGKRVTDLEALLVDRLAEVTGRERWSVFLDLDDILDRLAADADRWLAFQATHPVRH